MIKETITYTDFNGVEHTEDFYFNLTKPELIELEVEVEGGMAQLLDSIVKTEDTKGLVEYFKKLLLMAYGEKSADGKRFVKLDENGQPLSRRFAEHAAYPELYMKLATDDKAAARFINGIVPADVAPDQDKPQTPPAPPSLPEHLR